MTDLDFEGLIVLLLFFILDIVDIQHQVSCNFMITNIIIGKEFLVAEVLDEEKSFSMSSSYLCARFTFSSTSFTKIVVFPE